MNIIKDGKVVAAAVGDGVSFTADQAALLRQALNGAAGPLTIIVHLNNYQRIDAHLAVPEVVPPSTYIEGTAPADAPSVRPELDPEYQAVRLMHRDMQGACAGTGRAKEVE